MILAVPPSVQGLGFPQVPASSRTASADILQGLRQLAAIRGLELGSVRGGGLEGTWVAGNRWVALVKVN